MRIAEVSFFDFRGLRLGKVTLPDHGVLLGANNVGKTAVVDAIALVFGRERITSQLSDWDFYGGMPQPKSRFTIVCTVTDFSTNNPNDNPNWFSGEAAAQPVWWREDKAEITFETDCPLGAKLAAQVALCGRYEEDDCEFETKRYFYNGPGDPFTTPCDVVSLRRVEELGVFVIPANRQWDRLMSFASTSFLKALRQSDAIPGDEIEKLKMELRNSQSGIEESAEFKVLLNAAETELRSLAMLQANSSLVYRTTSLDTAGILQNLLPHVKDASGGFLPVSKHGSGMVSLQSFLVVLAIAQKRKKAGKNFILIAEEPELHLHPSLHKRLANRIRAVSTQSLVTTHSPLVAASYKPNESIFMRNADGNVTTERLRNEPIKDIKLNSIRKLYLERRAPFYEAILGPAVLVPEGDYDYEWLRLLQRMSESADELGLSSVPLSVVPTQDGAVVDTYSEVARFNSVVLPLVDGDSDGQKYLDLLLRLKPPPQQIVQLGNNAGGEVLAAWVLEPCLAAPGKALRSVLPQPQTPDLRELQKALALASNKKDPELRENLVSEAMGNPASVARASEFLQDLSAILSGRQPNNSGWTQATTTATTRIFVASHIKRG